MVRTKQTPRRIIPFLLSACLQRRRGLIPRRPVFDLWGKLPKDIRALICTYSPMPVELYFLALDSRIESYDNDSFFNTGTIRVRLDDGHKPTIRRFLGSDQSSIPKSTNNVKVYVHSGDLEQFRLWNAYSASLIGTSSCTVAKELEAAYWKPVCEWGQSCRLQPDREEKDKEYRAENQVIRTLMPSNCTTHTFCLGLIGEKLFPDQEDLYERPEDTICCEDSSEYGERCRSRNRIRCYDEETYRMERRAKYDSDYTSSEEEESAYESEYDSTTGEKIDSIRLADYDQEGKLCYKKPGQYKNISDRKQKFPNGHLKSIDGTTIIEPLSWRISINPKWRCIHDSQYRRVEHDEGMVIGRRHNFMHEVEPVISNLWEDEWTCWDDFQPGTIEAPVNLAQFYHMGIVKAYVPQPSFVELSAFKSDVVLPLLDAYYLDKDDDETDLLQISHYSLFKGLKRAAVYIEHVDLANTIVADADALYI